MTTKLTGEQVKEMFKLPKFPTKEAIEPLLKKQENAFLNFLFGYYQEELAKRLTSFERYSTNRHHLEMIEKLIAEELHTLKVDGITVSHQNVRAREDRWLVLETLYGLICVVIDGHGGSEAGEIAREMLALRLSELLVNFSFTEEDEPYFDEMLKSIFEEVDAKIEEVYAIPKVKKPLAKNETEALERHYRRIGGCTVSGFIRKGKRIAFFNIGDSTCGLVRDNKLYWRSEKHNLKNPAEIARGEVLGGFEKNLQVTRSLGDHDFKEKSPAITIQHQLVFFDLEKGDIAFAVTDGIEDFYDSQELANSIVSGKDFIREVYNARYNERFDYQAARTTANDETIRLERIIERVHDDIDDMTIIIAPY